MCIYVNNKKVNRNDNITKSFKYREFQSKDGNIYVKLDMNMVNKLQELRDWLGTSIVITSAYRSPRHNKNVGGVSNSQHVKGTAVDIQVKGYTPKEVARYGQALGFDGIGIYNTFTHLDTRGYKARWGNWTGVNSIKLKEKKRSVLDTMSKEELIKLIQDEIQKALKPNKEYTWANKHYNNLNKLGARIDEKNFAHYVNRGQMLAMIDKVVQAIRGGR